MAPLLLDLEVIWKWCEVFVERYSYWLGWAYQYFFWAVVVVLGWYFFSKNLGRTHPFWSQTASQHAIESSTQVPAAKLLK